MGELTTAVKHGMDITHVLLRNDQPGKITEEQRAGTREVWQPSLHNPSFSEYARICGAKGFLAAVRDDRDAALEEALGHAGPSLVGIVGDPGLIGARPAPLQRAPF